jgi:hypothetical protein
MNEILSRDEIARLVARNNEQDLARPEYRLQSDTPRPLGSYQQAANPDAGNPEINGWRKALHSRNWKIQRKGEKVAKPVTRIVRNSKGTWVEVPLNSRV